MCGTRIRTPSPASPNAPTGTHASASRRRTRAWRWQFVSNADNSKLAIVGRQHPLAEKGLAPEAAFLAAAARVMEHRGRLGTLPDSRLPDRKPLAWRRPLSCPGTAGAGQCGQRGRIARDSA